MKKYYFILVNELIKTFSEIQSGKEFNFAINSSESILSDISISVGDILIASISNQIYYKFEVIEKTEENLKLKKVFEIERDIDHEIEGEEGTIKEITKSQYDSICSNLFSEFSSSFSETENIKDSYGEKKEGPFNKIYYGSPGCGKSYRVKELTRGEDKTVVTFHPDTDYGSFVGVYKPSMKRSMNFQDFDVQKFGKILKEYEGSYSVQRFSSEYSAYLSKFSRSEREQIIKIAGKPESMLVEMDKGIACGQSNDSNDIITYEFVPQAFAKAYVKAWKNRDKKHFLCIEEINRGNCAQIFGDIFQLLDRNEEGYSEYVVDVDKDFAGYIERELSADENYQEKIRELENKREDSTFEFSKIALPNNLYIYATMNTSDQSLFPMDSAFKRRWDWEYIPICYEEYNEKGEKNNSAQFKVNLSNNESFSWLEFIEKVNYEIKNNPNLGMDKCIGNYFINPDNNEISLNTFINKAIFYLWNDVFKDEREDESIFKNRTTYEDFFPIESNGKEKVEEILRLLEVDIEKTEQSTENEE